MDYKKITCVAVDDEPPALQVIEKYIAAIPSLQLVASCGNAVDALALLQHNKIDLLFLDIQMPHIFGTDFMRTLGNPPKVIFTTAFRKYAVDGFDLDAVDYLLKPISFERFLKAVNKVMPLNILSPKEVLPAEIYPVKTAPDAFIYLRVERRNLKVILDDILFIESLKDYIKVVTKERTIVTKNSISTIEETLPGHLFIRIHRSFIVSVKQIQSFTPDIIQIGKYELPVSRSYRHEVEKLLSR